jgi:diguanylate cyclase (GGDEF)-like protein
MVRAQAGTFADIASSSANRPITPAQLDDLREEVAGLRRGMADSEARFENIVGRSGDGILVVDRDRVIQFANPAAEWMLGRPRHDLIGAQFEFPMVAGTVVEIRLVRPDREIVYADMRVADTTWDGQPAGLALLRDATDRRSVEARLAERATHDALTGLPNRFLLEDRLIQALERVKRAPHPVAVFFLDLNGFKRVNDLLGHGVGDEVLIETARRLRAAIRPADTAARLGGDEFVLVCESMEPAVADAMVGRLGLAFSESMVGGGWEITVGISVGMAVTDDPGASPSDLIGQADQAMYRDKRDGVLGRPSVSAST